MRAKSIGSSRTLMAAGIAALMCVPQLRADVGGGSGKPISPYPPGSPVTVQQVTKMRQKASATKAVSASIIGTDFTASGYKVGLAYVEDKKVVRDPMFKFNGVDEQNRQQEIDFADVTSFRLLHVDKKLFGKNEAVLELTIFPALTPQQLLAEKPSYSTLLENYKRIVQLKVMLQSGSDGELCMLGTSYKGNVYKVVFRIRDLKPGSEAKLDPQDQWSGQGLWWAIESVTADPAYPHRIVMKH
jgi:hypothetical protein